MSGLAEDGDPISRLYLRGAADGQRIRVAIVADGAHLTRVGVGVLTDLLHADFVDVVGAIWATQDDASKAQNSAHPVLAISPAANFAARCYESLIDSRRDDVVNPFEAAASTALLDLPQIDPDSSEAMGQVRSLSVDVVLHLGVRAIPSWLASCSTYGVWQFHYGDSSRYDPNVPYLSELISGDPILAAELRACNSSGVPHVLARTEFSATPFPSLRLNRYAPVMGSRHLAIQKLYELHRFGWKSVLESGLASPAAAHTAQPGNIATAAWMIDQALQKTKVRLQSREFTNHWQIGIRTSTRPLIDEPDPRASWSQFHWLHSPKGTFWADPFLLSRGTDVWLFMEEFPYQAPRAHLSCTRLNERGEPQEVFPVLKRPYHLSYPHVFEHDGEIFMIPETVESGQVELWRARQFPSDWILERVLLPLPCVDTTVFFRNERWWMFTSPMSVLGHAPITLLFFAQDLTGPWTHHPASPITRDVRVARGAGQIFEHGGRIIRPSQDCAIDYGYSLVFNEIVRMDESLYGERKIAGVLPDWKPNMRGVHTYNRAGTIEAIDGKFRLPSEET